MAAVLIAAGLLEPLKLGTIVMFTAPQSWRAARRRCDLVAERLLPDASLYHEEYICC